MIKLRCSLLRSIAQIITPNRLRCFSKWLMKKIIRIIWTIQITFSGTQTNRTSPNSAHRTRAVAIISTSIYISNNSMLYHNKTPCSSSIINNWLLLTFNNSNNKRLHSIQWCSSRRQHRLWLCKHHLRRLSLLKSKRIWTHWQLSSPISPSHRVNSFHANSQSFPSATTHSSRWISSNNRRWWSNSSSSKGCFRMLICSTSRFSSINSRSSRSINNFNSRTTLRAIIKNMPRW